MNYWLDLFTGTTWSEFREAGANVSGFRSTRQKMVERIKSGDILLCYLTGVMRWVGALEVIGPSKDERAIWKFDDFPARLDVKPLVMLNPENGIPMERLAGKVQFYQESKDAGKFKGFLRGSPASFARHEDGDLILQYLEEAKEHPITIPVDQRKLGRIPLYKTKGRVGDKKVDTVVSVPDTEEVEEISSCATIPISETVTHGTDHTQIQYLLLTLGAEMGLDIWVARNDRSKIWNDQMLGSLPRIAEELPTQFNEATQRTIELIDVLWLKGNSIVSAFEVECTTSIYSGLLRMSDLLALQPNLDIKLYLVAPGERRDKVQQEILRPTFQLRPKPLNKVCGYLALDKLAEKVEAIRKLGLASSLNPDFLVDTAEYFGEQQHVIWT
jgi:hypothetical protein